MASLSLCMIVKNEEKFLPRCLDSFSGVFDEIIIVDTGSVDSTPNIAKNAGAKVFHFEWKNNFAEARNYSFSLAECDFVMWLDADDIISAEDRIALIELKRNLSEDIAAVFMPYETRDANGRTVVSYLRERIVKRNMFIWEGRVHEVMAVGGKTVREKIAVIHAPGESHHSRRNLDIYEEMLKCGSILSPRESYYYARELIDNGEFTRAEIVLREFISSEKGWCEDVKTAYILLARCFEKIGKHDKRLTALYSYLDVSYPYADVCVELGRFYFEHENYRTAIFWYNSALNSPRSEEGFVCEDDYTYIPSIMLCVCFDRIGIREKAVYYNELAAGFHPGDKNAEYNRAYFADS